MTTDLDTSTAARIANLDRDDQAEERAFLRRWQDEQQEDYQLPNDEQEES